MDKSEGLNIEEEIKHLNNYMDNLNSHIAWVCNMRFYLLIYRLVKKGLINVSDIAEAADMHRTSVYRVVDVVEKNLEEKHGKNNR